MSRDMSVTWQVLRGTRAAIDSTAAAGELLAGEVILITDEGILAVATSTTAYVTTHTLQGTTGTGLLVDHSAPSFGWRDLIGDVIPKTSGVGSPTLATLTGNLRAYNYAAGEDGDCIFHMPHDYVPASALYLHPHWTHNGTNISGDLVVTVSATYAKGYQQASFHTQITTTITDGALTIANTPALFHRIPEVQLSTPGGSASMLDSNLLEVDGLVLIHYDVTTIPTITGGSGKPFLLTFDIHYQSTNMATKNKAPGFYA